jgi:hypothetical protein
MAVTFIIQSGMIWNSHMTRGSFKENKLQCIHVHLSCNSSPMRHNQRCPSVSLMQVLFRRGYSISKIFHHQYTVHIILMTIFTV